MLSIRKKDARVIFVSKFTLRFWPLLLLIPLLLLFLSVPRMIHLYKNISSDPMDLLPPDHPNVQSLKKVREKIETRNRMAIILESDQPAQTVLALKEIAERLEREPYVEKTVYRKAGYDFFNKYKMLFIDLGDLKTVRDRLDRRIQREKLKGFLIDLEEGEEEIRFEDLNTKYRSEYSESSRSEYFVSPDQKTYTLYVESKEPSTSLKSTSQFYDQVDSFLKTIDPKKWEPTLKLYLAGPTKVLEYRALISDLKKVGLISGLLIFIPLLIRFRSPIRVFLIFIPLLIGIPISLAVGSLFIERLSVTTSFLFAILGGLGIESGIHLYTRYHELRQKGIPLESALPDLYHSVARAILTSVASVAVTFLLLLFNDFRGFSEFGLIAGLGLWLLFLLYLLFFPALLLFAEKCRLLRFSPLPAIERKGLRISPKITRITFAVLILFSLGSFAAPFFVRFEYDSKKIRADIPEVRIAKEKQRTTSQRVNHPAAVIVESHEEAEALRQAFLKRKSEKKETTLDTVRSYYDLTPTDQQAKIRVIGEIRKLLDDPTLGLLKGERREDLDRFRSAVRGVKPFSDREVPEEVKEIFRANEKIPGTLFFINPLPHLELDDGRNAIRFAEEVSTISTRFGKYHPSSDANILGLVLMTLFGDTPRLLILSLLSVTLFVYLDFRSIRKTALVVSSILMGVFWLLGLMVLLDLRLNFYNLVILPAIMGMSIDNAIHLLHRYEELGPGKIRELLASTGTSCLLASLTNAAGFSGLLWSTHGGLYSIGLLAVLGVGTCLLSTLLFFPMVLAFLEKNRPAS